MTNATTALRPMRGLLLLLAAWVLVHDTQAQSSNARPSDDVFPAALFKPLPELPTPSSDLAIVFWLERHDPLSTFRHQAYDRRKGEYTPAVDDWLEMLRRQYPDYVTFVRYVDAGKRDVDEVVREAVDKERDELVDGLLQQQDVKRSRRAGGIAQFPGQAAPHARSSTRTGPFKHKIGIHGAPGSSGMLPGPNSPYLFPTPFPYPRPHP